MNRQQPVVPPTMSRSIRILALFIILPLLVQSCTGVLQSSWRDFNAYFNTYYNAKTSYDRGLELQNQQEITINPERPIRVHPTPRRAGLSDFEHAAQKSADVIRFHPRSRWVDNSIMMIGKSYFYQQRYFSADQKFVELLATTSDSRLRQEAIFWRGRAALELENYVEGVNYIQSRLFSTEFEWDRRIEADVRLIIAQLLVARGEYEEAVGYIADALPNIRTRRKEMRAWFLYGQLLESLQRYDEAFEAYARATHQSNPNYDLIYYAELKMGIVARKRGDLEWAYDHFVSMSRDDRHFNYIAAIEYQIARTMHDMERYTAARQRYEQVLRRRNNQPDRETQALLYYGMAEIYRDFYMDFTLTAAYFDSSARQANNPERLPEHFDADLMSRSYGEYSRLQSEVNRLDSLLWLGQLSEAEFDSVISEVRERKLAEIEQQEREQRRQQLVTITDMDEMGTQADEDTDNGFLNHKNQQLMLQNRQAFQALWGARPLVDDWRRMEAVRVNIVRQFEEEGEEIGDVDQAIEQAIAPQQQVVEIDLSGIPFTPEEQAETRRMIASHEYEIGNVFFTALAMPDSAARYYRRVMSRFPDSELAPQAIYSLSELYQAAGDTTQAVQYAMQLVDFYPNTVYAERMAGRHNLDLVREDYVMTREDSISVAYLEITDMGPDRERAAKLRSFAGAYPESEYAPRALYRAVLDYIEAAREEPLYAHRIQDLSTVRFIREQEEEEFEIFRDSVRALLADSAYMAVTARLDEKRLGWIPESDELEVPQETEADTDTDESAALQEREADTYTEEPEVPQETEADTVTEEPQDSADVMEVPPEPADLQDADEAEGISEIHETDVPQLSETGHDELQRPEIAPEDRPTQVHLQEILDKTLPEPDFSDLFPYEGALWDSARVVLITLRNEYADFPRSRIVNALAEEIEVDRVRALLVDTDRVYGCNELDQRPEIEGGVEGFIDASGFRDVINEHQISGTVAIQVLINKDGSLAEVSTEEEDDDLGIMTRLLELVERSMHFSVPEFTGVPVMAECEYIIEFDH